MKHKAPCKDCETRYVGCHDSCEKYIRYKQERESSLKYINDFYRMRYDTSNIKTNKK